MSSRVNDAPRASSRVIFYEDEQYTETRTTSRRPARSYRDDDVRYDDRPRGRTRGDDRYADDRVYADDRRDDGEPRSSRRRRVEDDAPRRRDEDDAPRRSSRSRSRDEDSYVRFDPDRPIKVKVEKDPEKKEGTFASIARTGAVWAGRALGIGGFALACLGGVLAVGGTNIIPGIGAPPNFGYSGVALIGVGGAAYFGGAILEKSLSKEKA